MHKQVLRFIIQLVPFILIRRLVILFRNSETNVGYYIRAQCYKRLCRSFGENVKISPYVFIQYPERISIGNNVSIQHFCFISGYGNVTIGNDVSIAPYTAIFSSSHPYKRDDINIRNAPLIAKPVYIGNNIWIGTKVTILFGVTINNGNVIGAHSLVTKNLNKRNSVFVGTPAKFLKVRTDT